MKSDREKLVQLGFKPAGYWEIVDGSLRYALHNHAQVRGVLYAFICAGRVRYVGKTRLTLQERMNGYRNPGKSQRTNVRNNRYINKELKRMHGVQILVFPARKRTYKGYSIAPLVASMFRF
jgi:hypothetical protein